ncbi:GNAT family N-acetyltransferase [Streptomyces sp. NBC_01476]|uniref:GNAT family N-acetyltransferase n=1 Tax=Streptomyces sp. NBC_01476 TaxID=2903881 RepID=UPI002E30166B|nr:GNAT family N-acetyltransferase [Streptomyces sp. NBC_01476]
MAEVFTRRLSRWQAEQQRDEIADLYVEAYHGPAGEEFSHREAFLARFDHDTAREGFDMVAASEGATVGAAYGFRLDRADNWWRNFTGNPPPRLEELTASGQVFALAELMVRPAYRRQGVAARLMEQLLLRSEATLASALVDPGEPGAGSALRALGWDRIGEARFGPDAPARQVWTRALGGD